MDEKSLTHQLLRTGTFLLIAAVVVLAGWNEPLRYLFMEREEVAVEELKLYPAPERTGNEWFPAGTALDRGPYRTTQRGLRYTNNFDSQKMGTRTETDERDGLRRR